VSVIVRILRFQRLKIFDILSDLENRHWKDAEFDWTHVWCTLLF